MDAPTEAAHERAERLLKRCALPEARLRERVWLIEPGCICFTTRAPISQVERAHTALIRDVPGLGERVTRIHAGWTLPAEN